MLSPINNNLHSTGVFRRLVRKAGERVGHMPAVAKGVDRFAGCLRKLEIKMLGLTGQKAFNIIVTEGDLMALVTLAKSEQELRGILERSPDMVYIQDQGTGDFLWVNALMRRKLSLPADEVVKLKDVLNERSSLSATEEIGKAEKGRGVPTLEFILKTGEIVEVRGVLIEYKGKTCILGIARDITRRKYMEQAIDAMLEIDAQIAQGGKLDDILTLIVDEARRVLPYVNLCSIKTVEETSSGSGDGELIVKAESEGFPPTHKEGKERPLSTRAFRGGTILATNNAQEFGTSAGPHVRSALHAGLWVTIKHAGGEATDKLGVISIYSNTQGVFTDRKLAELSPEDMRKNWYLSLVYSFITRAASAMRTAKLATTDGLTGLPDNVSFDDNLARRIKSAYYTGKPISVLFVDADFFKYVNEIFGNKPAGDNVLRNLAAMLAKNRRGSDLVARVGGDEFAFILVDADEEGAKRAADRIEREFEEIKFYVEANVLSKEFLQRAINDGVYLGKEGNKHVLRLTVSVGRRTLSPEELANFDPANMEQIHFVSEALKADADADMKKRKAEMKMRKEEMKKIKEEPIASR